MRIHIFAALITNGVFFVFHPSWSIYPPVVQSLAINIVIFFVPAVPFLGMLQRREVSPRWLLLFAMLVSFAALVGVLVFFYVTGWPLTGTAAWNATWAATNGGFLFAAVRTGGISAFIPFKREPFFLFGSLFLAAYVFYFYGAVSVVPEQYDHDLEVHGTGYGLLTRFEPLLLTDRDTIYYFAHPPLLHYYVAASFLYYDKVNHLKYFDIASRRVLASDRGESFIPPATGFRRVGESDYIEHTVLGVEKGRYRVTPALPSGESVIPVRELELGSIYQHYAADPHKLETRTPSIFLAALTVALLGCWGAGLSGRWWAGLLLALAYATSPEVFVRSSYGGYFAIGNFALLLMLLATSLGDSSDEPDRRLYGYAAGLFAAWSDHKLLLFPLALFLWQFLKGGRHWKQNLIETVSQPVILGFAFGTLLYWAYGSSINPSVFWLDHVRTHLFDRLLHHNPLGYSDYPTVLGLWIEFWEHTGYLLLPLGALTLCLSLTENRGIDKPIRGIAGLWAVYALINVAVFSWADWRMTKHLTFLLLLLFLAPPLWAGKYPRRLVFISAIFLLLLGWNAYTVQQIAQNFSGFNVSPAW